MAVYDGNSPLCLPLTTKCTMKTATAFIGGKIISAMMRSIQLHIYQEIRYNIHVQTIDVHF